MSIRVLRFIALMLAALGMTMGMAHLLELAPRMRYDAKMYEAVTKTMYRFYGIAGGPVQIAAVLAAAGLAYRVRGRPGFRLALGGAFCLALSVALWFALVQPVNAQWAHILQTNPMWAPDLYLQLRDGWEYGHVCAFVVWLSGVCLLTLSVLAETPKA
jgi:hypothetical protein